MKKLYLILLLASAALAGEPSLFVNGQMHSDVNRELFTSTIEILHLDKRGSSFLFADFDFDSAGQTLSYFEVSHNLLLRQTKLGGLNLSLQFNDGVSALDDLISQKTIPRTVLAGPTLSNVTVGPAICEFQALYRQEFGADPGWQLTAVWFLAIAKTPLEFLGYVDWNSNEYGDNPTSLQAEPQLQYRWRQLALGSELEISRNFQGAWTKDDGFEFHKWYLHPTIYLRYDL